MPRKIILQLLVDMVQIPIKLVVVVGLAVVGLVAVPPALAHRGKDLLEELLLLTV